MNWAIYNKHSSTKYKEKKIINIFIMKEGYERYE